MSDELSVFEQLVSTAFEHFAEASVLVDSSKNNKTVFIVVPQHDTRYYQRVLDIENLLSKETTESFEIEVVAAQNRDLEKVRRVYATGKLLRESGIIAMLRGDEKDVF
jgi:hypothetical protein